MAVRDDLWGGYTVTDARNKARLDRVLLTRMIMGQRPVEAKAKLLASFRNPENQQTKKV